MVQQAYNERAKQFLHASPVFLFGFRFIQLLPVQWAGLFNNNYNKTKNLT